MNDSVKQSRETQDFACPSCGNKGKSVQSVTIESLVKEDAWARVEQTEGFRFCAEVNCEVVYYQPESTEVFSRDEINVQVGQKETASSRQICYCFNYTAADIEGEIRKTGASTIPETIAEKCRAGLDRCRETNPQGACCLGNVRTVIKNTRRPSAWKSLLAIVPGIGMAILPTISCPACWPAYASLLGAVGLGFLLNNDYLFYTTLFFLTLAIFSLAYRARRRHGYAPFGLGVLAAGIILAGKFYFMMNAVMYGGIALLIAASLWNALPVRKSGEACSTCAS